MANSVWNRPSGGGLVLVILLLAACASDVDPGKPVDRETALAPMRQTPLIVPPDLVGPAMSQDNAIPDLDRLRLSTLGRKALGSGAVQPDFAPVVSLHEAGDQSWLEVATSAEALWPQLRQFWIAEGYTLSLDSPASGQQETRWKLENLPDGSPANERNGVYSNRYRTQVQTNNSPATQGSGAVENVPAAARTRITLTQEGLVRVGGDWQARPASDLNPLRMLQRLRVRLGASADIADAAARATMPGKPGEAARTPAATQRARLEGAVPGDDKGIGQAGREEPAITVVEPFDRAWRRVGLALEHAGYSISDRDRSKGIFYAVRRPAPDATEPHWWQSKPKADSQIAVGVPYQWNLQGAGTQSRLQVRTPGGEVLPAASALALLEPVLVEINR